jgi:FAM192A/Fyv6, N-terminal domain
MSLSFVTKAIQTTAADGTFEETAVANAEDHTTGRDHAPAIGLFDQLRQNQDAAEAARLEFQRSMMRGTLALDEDDVAHLQQLQQQKEAEHMTQLQQTESQLASFRAAQAERRDRSLGPSVSRMLDAPVLEESTEKPISVPAIRIRKRKRQEPDALVQHRDKTGDPVSEENAPNQGPSNVAEENEEGGGSSSVNPSNALSSLLSGYSSDESA